MLSKLMNNVVIKVLFSIHVCANQIRSLKILFAKVLFNIMPKKKIIKKIKRRKKE